MSKAAQLKKKAAEFEQKKQYDRALTTFIQAIDAAAGLPDEVDIPLYNRVGDLYFRLGDTDRALSYYEKAIDLYTEGGFFNNAIALCNKVLRHAPSRTSIYYKLGRISAKKGFNSDAKQNFLEYAGRMQKAGQMDEAFRALKEFADLCPGQDDVRLMLAEQLSRVGRKDEALEQLQVVHDTMVAEDRTREASATLERMRAIDPTFQPKQGSVRRAAKRDGLVFIDVSDTPVLTTPVDPLPGLESSTAFEAPTDSMTRLEIEPTMLTPEPEPEPASDTVAEAEPEAYAEVPAEPIAEVEPIADAASVVEQGEAEEPTELLAESVDVAPPQLPQGLAFEPETVDLAHTESAAEPAANFTVMTVASEVAEREGTEPETNASETSDAADLTGETAELDPTSSALDETPISSALEITSREGDGAIEFVPAYDSTTDSVEPEQSFDSDASLFAGTSDAAEEVLPASPTQAAQSLTPEADPDPVTAETQDEWAQTDQAAASSEPETPFSGALDDEPTPGAFQTPAASQNGVWPNPEASPDVEAPPRLSTFKYGAPPDERFPLAGLAPRVQEPCDVAVPEPPPVVLGRDDEQVDLGAWLRDTEPAARNGDGQADDLDFSDMLELFKRGVAESVDEADSDSHYDLGVAYKEMGLVAEAVAQFEKAIRGGAPPERRVRAYESLGECYIEARQYDTALSALSGALTEPGLPEDKMVGALYLLGYAAERLDRWDDARGYYKRVFAIDPAFRDIGDRLRHAMLVDDGAEV